MTGERLTSGSWGTAPEGPVSHTRRGEHPRKGSCVICVSVPTLRSFTFQERDGHSFDSRPPHSPLLPGPDRRGPDYRKRDTPRHNGGRLVLVPGWVAQGSRRCDPRHLRLYVVPVGGPSGGWGSCPSLSRVRDPETVRPSWGLPLCSHDSYLRLTCPNQSLGKDLLHSGPDPGRSQTHPPILSSPPHQPPTTPTLPFYPCTPTSRTLPSLAPT